MTIFAPKEAFWSDEENEWVVAERDAVGRFEGFVRFFRKSDRSLVAECTYVDGKIHGLNVRYHENGSVASETPYVAGVIHGRCILYPTRTKSSERMPFTNPPIVRGVIDVDQGLNHEMHLFDDEGVERTVRGELLPPRPTSVDPKAVFDNGVWLEGRWDTTGRRQGRTRVWSPEGKLQRHVDYVNEQRHGALIEYLDGEPRLHLHYVRGAIDGPFEIRRPDGSCRKGAIAKGRHTAELVDYDENGTAIRSSWARAPEDDGEWGAKVDAAAEALTAAQLAAGPMGAIAYTPATLASAIATGWGGDEDRDAALARSQRALVLRHAPAAVRDALTTLDLHLAPRVITRDRCARLLTALSEDLVDHDVLIDSFGRLGGEAATIWLSADDSRSFRAVYQRFEPPNPRAQGDMLEMAKIDLKYLALDRVPDAVGAFPRVTDLDMRGNRLDTLSPSIADMVFLRSIQLNDNQIRTIPRELGLLTELGTLFLENNGLTEIPEGLTGLRQLHTLSLSGNALTELPETFSELAELRTLWLARCPLARLPKSFSQLRKLVFLHLDAHPFEEPPEVIFDLPALEELWISSPNLKRLPAAIGRLTKLRRLMFWHSPVSTLPEELFTLKGLEEIRLGHCPLPDELVARVRAEFPKAKIF
ncbi:MAG: leucine-rich repeat protein [Myxococcota bacterium]|nr:leucine-rich repeat protein [Myxococcota bacterium]